MKSIPRYDNFKRELFYFIILDYQVHHVDLADLLSTTHLRHIWMKFYVKASPQLAIRCWHGPCEAWDSTDVLLHCGKGRYPFSIHETHRTGQLNDTRVEL